MTDDALALELAALKDRVAVLEQAIMRMMFPVPPPNPDFTPNPLGGQNCRRCGTLWPTVWMSILPPCSCYGLGGVTYTGVPP